MKTKKRFLSILLSLAMVSGFMMLMGMGTAAWAEEQPQTEWSRLQTAIGAAGNGNTIKVGDYAGNDKTITATADERALLVEVGKAITLDLDGCTLNGGGVTGENGRPVLFVVGTLTIKDSRGGGKITGGADGGIYLTEGELTMNGGSVIGNNGGGVVLHGGSFTMTDGTITGNSSTGGGGGVIVDENYHNSGGGTFTMKGGAITGNTGTDGGGVYVCNGSFIMRSGSITDNTATESGGGVFATSYSNGVEMTGGTITKNTANNYGGGVAIEYGANAPVKFKVSGSPTVSGNKLASGAVNDVSITTSVNPVMIIGALTGGSICINQDAGEIVAVADNYELTAGDAAKFHSSTNAAVVGVLEEGRVVFKNSLKTAQIAAAPRAKPGLAFTGTAQDLVSAGTASGGEMQYALGTATEATEQYTASIPTATNAGTYYVWYKVKGDANYLDSGSKSVKVAIGKASIAKAKVTLEQASYAYDGKAKEPAVKSVVLDGKTLSAKTDYTVGYKDNQNVGTATAVVTGVGNYKDSAKATFTIKVPPTPAKTSIAKAKVTLAKTSYAYDGKAKKPKVKSVVLNGKKLKAGTDYAAKYANNKKLGTATVTVTGKGSYKDSAKATFKIKLGKAKVSTVGSTGKKTMKVSWKKVAGAKKYQMQYRQVGGKWKTATVKGTSKTVKNLKAGKRYQFRVRAVAGKQKGAWSNASKRWLKSVKGLKAMSKKAGTVTATWKADSKANAGYLVVVRYQKGGAIVAKASVAAGKTKATVKGLEAGKKLYVAVRPLLSSGGKTYAGVLHSAWAKDRSGKSAKAPTTQAGSLTAAKL